MRLPWPWPSHTPGWTSHSWIPSWLLVAALVFALAGCEQGILTPGGQVVRTVTISPLEPRLALGQALQLEALVHNRQGHPLLREAEWSVSDLEVATVDAGGLLQGVRTGEAEVSAVVEGVIGSTKVIVAPALPSPFPEHLCALSGTGHIWCWGRGPEGELGSGAVASSAVPVLVNAPPPNIDVAVGSAHTCAIREGGQAACWGRGAEGQLGNGALDEARAPVVVKSTVPLRQIVAGERHTCALSLEGEAYCWGWNPYGQIGNASTVGQFLPALVDTPLRFKSITAGARHTCAVAQDGSAWCWGENATGQVGTGVAGEPSLLPARVTGSVAFQQISAGLAHTCALTVEGLAWCWGAGERAQQGDGQLNDRATPVRVSLDIRYQDISAGALHTCAVAFGGAAYCWGEGRSGQIGNGGKVLVGNPTAVAGTGWISIHAGSSHSCGVRQDLRAYCWGFGGFGQTGNGQHGVSLLPQRVLGDTDLIRMGS